MKKTVLTCCVALMGLLSQNSAKAQHPSCHSTSDQRPNVAKVMSFNIRYHALTDTADMAWPRRIDPCRRMIEQYSPDVVGVQELRTSMERAAESIFPGYGMVNVPSPEGVSDKQTGPATVFWRKDKYEILDSGFFWLSATPNVRSLPWNSTDHHYRAAAWAHLRDKDTDADFFFVTTHFPYKKEPVDTEVRAKCCNLIIDRMDSIAGKGATVFITGDMNASYSPNDSRRESIRPMFERMKSAREQAEVTDNQSSFNGFGRVIPGVEGKNLDHIFYRNAHPLVFETVNRPLYGDVRWISDHYPIVCTFTY